MCVITAVRNVAHIFVSRPQWGVVLVTAVALAMALCACSPKKNTAATRNYQAFITRYNVYFNGDEHYKGDAQGDGGGL